MNASHLRRKVSSLASGAPPSPKHPALDRARRPGSAPGPSPTASSLLLSAHHLLGRGEEELRDERWQLQLAAGEASGQEAERPHYPCRCHFGRWGRLCGRRKGHGPPRRAPSPSSCRRAGGRTPDSTSSHPAPLSRRGRRSAASGGTVPGTGWDSAQSQRPGGREKREGKRNPSAGTIEAERPGDPAGVAQEGTATRGTLGVRHLPVPGVGGAGQPGKGTACANRDSSPARSACSGFFLPLSQNETFSAVDWLRLPPSRSGGRLPFPAPPAQVL